MSLNDNWWTVPLTWHTRPSNCSSHGRQITRWWGTRTGGRSGEHLPWSCRGVRDKWMMMMMMALVHKLVADLGPKWHRRRREGVNKDSGCDVWPLYFHIKWTRRMWPVSEGGGTWGGMGHGVQKPPTSPRPALAVWACCSTIIAFSLVVRNGHFTMWKYLVFCWDW